jgi:uncharacterized damage-inducible protein DinB
MATTSAELLLDGFGRVREAVHEVVEGLSADDLAYRVDPQANSIGWLVWHLTRVQDDHVADVAETDQVWTANGWADRFGLPFPPSEHGYGHSSEEVGQVRVASPDLLTGYYDEVHEQTVAFVEKVTDEGLARVVDERWDPPVTLAVRLMSVISDDLQHSGQAAFIRGVLSRR